MKLLALDLGTSLGWALSDVEAGTLHLKPGRFESAGMRFVRFRKHLQELLSSGVTHVAYEEVRRHLGVDAAHIYGGLLAIVQEECESRRLQYFGVPVGTIKKTATGKGNASKEQMLEAARLRWPAFTGGEDEADARFVRLCAIDLLGSV